MRHSDTICLILGGGRGTRLDPLTRYRSKPAVPLAGKFRLVDIPISNSINSGLNKIFVITQFHSASLNAHISRTYQFDQFHQGFVEVLAAEQTTERAEWFQGTADAVRKSLVHFRDFAPRDVLILSGDQLYRMDFREIIRQHRKTGSEITIAVHPVPAHRTRAFGLAQIDPEGRVRSFLEKPESPDLLAGYALSGRTLVDGRPQEVYPASMGIYVFDFDVLEAELRDGDLMDFGKEILPRAVGRRHVRPFIFSGYWEDIGTIRAFYEANLALAGAEPPLRFHEPGAPIYTRARFLAPSRIERCTVSGSMICDGCYLSASVIESSVIGIRSMIRHGSVLKRTVVMGADGYEGDLPRPEGAPPLGIGRDCAIEGAIIDKNARIGDKVRITARPRGAREDHDLFHVRDGIVVIPKNTVIPAGTVI